MSKTMQKPSELNNRTVMQGKAKAANFATINIDEKSSGKDAIRQNGSGDNLSTLS